MANIDYEQLKLIPASLEDYPTLQNMGRFYVYDMSEYMGNEAGWEMPEDGLYECIDFKKYWQADAAFPFLIRYKNELVGFLIVDKKGSDAAVDYNMAQFFIIRKFKGQGVGQFIAHQCFDKFKGTWEVMVMPGNQGAYQFWRSVITSFTSSNYTEFQKNIQHLNNCEKNIFRFNSVKLQIT